MPLLRKAPFKRQPPPPNLKAEDGVFFCEATKEVFRDYEEFFQRTILCNSLLWSCTITGKCGLTYEEALESEKRAKKRLGAIPKTLKNALIYCANRTKRGRLGDLVDDVYKFCNNRFFIGETVEAIINEMWCECIVLGVLSPTEEDFAQEEKEGQDSSPKKKKDPFFPPDHLFKYEVRETDPDDTNNNPNVIVQAEDIRREKGVYTREKNLLFLKNLTELGSDGNFNIKSEFAKKYKVDDIKFNDIFDGPEPVFEETKRTKGSSSTGMKKNKHQATLDGWMKNGKSKAKKQTPAEIEAEMKRIREQNIRFKEEMRQRAEEAKKRKLEEKAKEKERKKEEKKLLMEILSEWTKPKEDLTCEDHKDLPIPQPVHCKIPNHLFGDFLMLLEFYSAFSELLEVKDSFPNGITFNALETALTEAESLSGNFYDVLSFSLNALFDLQREEEEEVKMHKNVTQSADLIDKNSLGKDIDIANQIRSATEMSQWSNKYQGQRLADLHMDQWSITEILRIHLESAGAFRGEKLGLWRYQQRGGYRLSDDPGLHFRMEEPQILEALTYKTVFELSAQEKMKILICLMEQILSFATVRDEIDERFHNYNEAKSELRNHQINENKRQRQVEEAKKAKLKEEKNQKRDDEVKNQEKVEEKKVAEGGDGSHLTTRQKEVLQSQKEKEEKNRQKKEDLLRSEAQEKEKVFFSQIEELQAKVTMSCLGRDRSYRRFWLFDTIPGLFVEDNDDFVGKCLPEPTPYNPNAGPMDESTAMLKVKEIMSTRDKKNEEKSSSDKENDSNDSTLKENAKTYSRKCQQKVLSTKNGTLISATSASAAANGISTTTNNNSPSTSTTTTIVATSTFTDTSDRNDCDLTTTTAKMHDSTSTSSSSLDIQSNKTEESIYKPSGVCLSDPENCSVHSTILPRTHWSYFNQSEDIEALIEGLNPRGIREKDLKAKLISEKDRLMKNLKKFSKIDDKLNQEDVDKKEVPTSISSLVDLTLRDQILDLEEKIFFGTLGTLKIQSREKWQNALQAGNYDRQCSFLIWGKSKSSSQDTPFDSRVDSIEGSRSGSPTNVTDEYMSTSAKVRDLACAILQVGQMVDEKFLKEPLLEGEKSKKKRLKEDEKRRKEKEDEEYGSEESSKTNENLTPFQMWEKSLMNSTSYAQLFLHLTTLENSIIWSKSVMNTRCRICRRKTDPEKMLLCDGCDRGHHMYCLKPKIKSVPDGDWFCNECKPKERVRSPKKSRRVFSTADDSDNEDTEDDDQMETGEERVSEEEEDSLIEEKKRKKSGKKHLDPSKKRRTITQLLGKRRSATEATEKITKAVQETSSGNSSGTEGATGERISSRRCKRNLEPSISSSNLRVSKKRKKDEGMEVDFNPTILEDLLNTMMKHKDGWPFDRPITKTEAPDYHKIIRKPMDLGTIRSGINRMKYTSNGQVLDDIKLVFLNCWTYNREDAEEYLCGVRLEKYFLKEVTKLGLGHLLEEKNEDLDKTEKRGRKTL